MRGPIGLPQEGMTTPALSPDGRFVAVSVAEEGSKDIWRHGTERLVTTRLTAKNPGWENRPVWSPDGKRIAYSSVQSGDTTNMNVSVVLADGSQEPELLIATGQAEHVTDWSADGHYVLYQNGAPGGPADIWYVRRQDDGSFGEPAPVLESPFRETVAKLSPDGRYLTYCSDETGRDEVYVQRFPDGGEKTPISSNGGTQPRWSRDGTELFYVQQDTLMAVPVTLSPAFSARPAKRLFRHPGLEYQWPEQQYDVSADGEQFVVIESVEPGEEDRPVIHVVENWTALLGDQEER